MASPSLGVARWYARPSLRDLGRSIVDARRKGNRRQASKRASNYTTQATEAGSQIVSDEICGGASSGEATCLLTDVAGGIPSSRPTAFST